MRDDWASEYGYTDLELVEREGVSAYADTEAYVGGLYDPGGGHLHPLNYCLGLARAAEDAGVRIFEDSRVTAMDQGAKAIAHTAHGKVRADHLVLATNAYLGNLVPRMRRRIMPVGTYIGATPQLGENRAKALMPANAGVTDCAFVLDYFRRSADHRMLFGGRVRYSTIMPPNLPAAMRRKMLTVFPQLEDQPLEFAWGGYVGITVERTPHLGRLDRNVFFAQGFSGHGVALTGMAGRVMAEAVAGQAERFDIFTRLPHTPFPGGRLFRTPMLALAMLWYRMRDMVG
jgi:gamma-glutamylputrescine oxidase